MTRTRRNKSLVRIRTVFALVNNFDTLLFQFGQLCLSVWHVKRQMVNTLTMFIQETVQKRLVTQRLQQFEGQAVEVKFKDSITRFRIGVFVKKARAENAFEELAGLGG